MDGHTIQLNGVVDSFAEKSRAEDIAFMAPGVADVDNRLAVNNPGVVVYDPYIHEWKLYNYPWYNEFEFDPTKSDAAIREDIIQQFIWSPFVDEDSVNIHVDKGVVTLTGSVDSWNEYFAAEENARQGGAIHIDNEIVVH